MEIKIEMDGDVVILKMIGQLVASTAEELKTQVDKLIGKKYVHLLFDLSKVDFIDSSGLGACIAANRLLAGNSGKLICSGLNESVRKLFRLTRADQKISVVESRQEALSALLEQFAKAKKI